MDLILSYFVIYMEIVVLLYVKIKIIKTLLRSKEKE